MQRKRRIQGAAETSTVTIDAPGPERRKAAGRAGAGPGPGTRGPGPFLRHVSRLFRVHGAGPTKWNNPIGGEV